jgi:DedD protein
MKNLWLVLVLVAAGVIIFSLSLNNKPQAPQGVVLEEVFKQTPTVPEPAAMQPVAEEKTQNGMKDPVPSPAIVTMPEDGKETDFVVQVYSFQSSERAARALENLKAAGYNAFQEVSDLGEKGTWYRVRIGGLESEEKAKALVEEIRKNYNGGFIIKPKR